MLCDGVECDKSYSPGRVYQISQHGSVVECVSFQAYIGTQSLFPVRQLRAPDISCKGSFWTR